MFFLHIVGIGIKESMHEIQGFQFGSVVHYFGLFLWFFWLVPQLGCLGRHRPSNSATSVPLKEWNYNQTEKCSLFVQPYVLKVACHPVTIGPCIGAARTTALQSKVVYIG